MQIKYSMNNLKSKLIRVITLSTALILSVHSYAEQGTQAVPNTSEEILINGAKGLENWNQLGSGNWHVEDGAIVADSGSGFLVSKKSYANFRLTVEFWADHTTNSGIFIRADDASYINAMSAYEVNIFDRRSNRAYGTGGIVGVAAVDPMPTSGGQWNTYEIVADGNKLNVKLNGKQTVDVTSDRHDKGPIALQIGYGAGTTGIIKWRKVAIEPLKSSADK